MEHHHSVTAPAGAKMVSVEATILRAKPCAACGFGNKYDASECESCGADVRGDVSNEEPQGIVSFWHKSPWRRAAYRIGRGEYDTALTVAAVGLTAVAAFVVVRRLRRRS